MLGLSAIKIAEAAGIHTRSTQFNWAHGIPHAQCPGMDYPVVSHLTEKERADMNEVKAGKRDISQQAHNLAITPAAGNQLMSVWMESPLHDFVKKHGVVLHKTVEFQMRDPQLHIASSASMRVSNADHSQYLQMNIAFYPICEVHQQQKYQALMSEILEQNFLPKPTATVTTLLTLFAKSTNNRTNHTQRTPSRRALFP